MLLAHGGNQMNRENEVVISHIRQEFSIGDKTLEVPKDIKRLLAATGEDIQKLDYYVFHQANAFINNYIAKKMKLDKERIPWTIQKYGNTSSVSVPLTIASELKNKMAGEKRLLLSAFGVGMAWATAIVPFVDCKISDIVEI